MAFSPFLPLVCMKYLHGAGKHALKKMGKSKNNS